MGDLSILVVSGDSNFKDFLANQLLMEGHYVDSTDSLEIAHQMLQRMFYDLVLLNISDFTQESELLFIEEINEITPESAFVFLLNPDIEAVIERRFLTRQRFKNCLIKPFLINDLPIMLENVTEQKRMKLQAKAQKAEIQQKTIERRSSLRIETDIPIKYTFLSPLGNIPSEENISKIVNISQDGVMFKVDFKIKFGEFVYLSVLLPMYSSPINIEGKIIWETFNNLEPWRYVGIKFSNVKQENKKQIESFIHASH